MAVPMPACTSLRMRGEFRDLRPVATNPCTFFPMALEMRRPVRVVAKPAAVAAMAPAVVTMATFVPVLMLLLAGVRPREFLFEEAERRGCALLRV